MGSVRLMRAFDHEEPLCAQSVDGLIQARPGHAFAQKAADYTSIGHHVVIGDADYHCIGKIALRIVKRSPTNPPGRLS